jgi:hypothetical protein
MQSFFVHTFVCFTHEYHALKTRLTHMLMCWQMKYELMNKQMSHKFHIFLYICVINVFSMHDIIVWNVQIMNDRILHDFHY